MSDTPQTGSCCVLLTRSPRIDVRAVSRPLAKHFRRPLIDVTTHLRDALGVVYRNLPRDEAEAIAAILEEAGQPAIAVEQDDLLDIPQAMRVKRAAVFEDELVIWVPRTEEPVGVPWHKIAVLSLGIIRLYEPEMELGESENFKKLVDMEGIPEARDHLKAQVAEDVLAFGQSDAKLPPQTGEELLESKVGKLPLEYHLDLVLVDPLFVVRLTEHQFNFEDLEGACNSTLRNYHLLLTRIVDQATEALVTPATERFLEWGTVEADLFEEVREFEAFTRWLVQVKLPEVIAAAEAMGDDVAAEADEELDDDLDDLEDPGAIESIEDDA